MPFSRHPILVPIILMATYITAGVLAAQPKTPVPDAQAQQTAKSREKTFTFSVFATAPRPYT